MPERPRNASHGPASVPAKADAERPYGSADDLDPIPTAGPVRSRVDSGAERRRGRRRA